MKVLGKIQSGISFVDTKVEPILVKYWKIIFPVIVAGFLFVKFGGSDNNDLLKQWQQWRDTAKNAVEWSKKMDKVAQDANKRAADEAKISAKLEAKVAESKRAIVGLSKNNADLYKRLQNAGTLDTSLVIERFKPVITLVKNQKIEIDTLKSIVKNDSLIIISKNKQIDWLGQSTDLQKTRADSLQFILVNQPKNLPGECKFLKYIPCPNRKQAAIAGITMGVLGTIGITHKL